LWWVTAASGLVAVAFLNRRRLLVTGTVGIVWAWFRFSAVALQTPAKRLFRIPLSFDDPAPGCWAAKRETPGWVDALAVAGKNQWL
jgi:hypothetical protein